jgi:diguanylate cyclase (GGDEF)-like protein/PAS domain S-box-containing protein
MAEADPQHDDADRWLRYRAAIEHAGDGFFVVDRTLRVVEVNDTLCAMFGYARHELLGRNPLDFATPETRATVRSQWQSIDRVERRRYRFEGQRKDGSRFPALVRSVTHRGADGTTDGSVGFVTDLSEIEQAMLSDITERKASQARMAFLAHHDPLTQLPNRLLLRDRVDQAISRAARSGTKLALLFVDLDDFKRVNDSFGHQTGDALLREIAGRLAHCVRETDTVSRYGGDEFVIALPDLTDVGVIERVARCIAEQVSAPLHAGGVEVRVSCSIGVALYPGDGEDCDALVQRADASMYAAKRAGRAPS